MSFQAVVLVTGPKPKVFELAGKGGNKNLLLHHYRENHSSVMRYCTRACVTRTNTLQLTRDISWYLCNKIYI